MRSKKFPPLPGILVLVFLLELGYFFIGPHLTGDFPYQGLIISELIFLFLPALYYRHRFGIHKREGSFDGASLLGVTVLILCAFPIILLINSTFLYLLHGTYELKNNEMIGIHESNFMYLIFFLGLLPALMEETFFRGLLFPLLRPYGMGSALLLTAILFGVFHFDLQNFIAPFLFSLLLSIIYEKLNHLGYVIYGHFLHNFLSISFLKFYNEARIKKWAASDFVVGLGGVQNFIMISLILLSILCLIGLILGLKNLKRVEREPIMGRKRVRINELWPLLFIFGVYIFGIFGG